MAPNNRFAAALFLAAAVGSFSSLEASVVQTVGFDDKVAAAEAIVLGKCVRTRSEWDPSRRWIITYSTFAVEKAMKGRTGQEVTVALPGGTVGDIHQDTIGVPEFREGSENVVFVKRSALGPTVLYFDQGAYDVVKDSRGERVIAPVSSDAVRVDSQRGAVVSLEQPRVLSDFEGTVRAAVKRDQIQRMQVMRRKQKAAMEADSFWGVVGRNKWIILLAFAGIAMATWRLLRR